MASCCRYYSVADQTYNSLQKYFFHGSCKGIFRTFLLCQERCRSQNKKTLVRFRFSVCGGIGGLGNVQAGMVLSQFFRWHFCHSSSAFVRAMPESVRQSDIFSPCVDTVDLRKAPWSNTYSTCALRLWFRALITFDKSWLRTFCLRLILYVQFDFFGCCCHPGCQFWRTKIFFLLRDCRWLRRCPFCRLLT